MSKPATVSVKNKQRSKKGQTFNYANIPGQIMPTTEERQEDQRILEQAKFDEMLKKVADIRDKILDVNPERKSVFAFIIDCKREAIQPPQFEKRNCGLIPRNYKLASINLEQPTVSMKGMSLTGHAFIKENKIFFTAFTAEMRDENFEENYRRHLIKFDLINDELRFEYAGIGIFEPKMPKPDFSADVE